MFTETTVRGNHWILRGFCKVKGSDGFPERLVSSGCMTEGYLGLVQCIALDKYHEICKICADAFELGANWILQTHHLLDFMKIAITNLVFIVL